MKTRLQLESLPPSVNHIYRSARSRTDGSVKVYRTKEYNTWANAVGYSINRQMAKQPRWGGPVYIINNDKLIHGWNAYWSNDLPSGIAAEISITAADPVTIPERRRAA